MRLQAGWEESVLGCDGLILANTALRCPGGTSGSGIGDPEAKFPSSYDRESQPEEGFLNPTTTAIEERRILPSPWTATRCLQRRRTRKTPEPGPQRRHRQEACPTSRETSRRQQSAQTGHALGRAWPDQVRSNGRK
ncbi:hypothetical protein NDU88_005326 [Pleurodeles waltl]|uniref:Uncharacterized protein n=1 Tax=Pleurodeles waltl TaxID=8319 RepID=A0AAV7WXY5_PLEWA|nr:hypothetical protein NDU88_005326 [Pleurodeles waltl]